MKNQLWSLAFVLVTGSYGSQLLASHVPSIEVKIDGNAERFVKPELVFNDAATRVELYRYEDVYLAEDIVPGSYTLTLVDKDKGTVLLIESMSVKQQSSHHVSGNTRHIDCSWRNGAIVCANYY